MPLFDQFPYTNLHSLNIDWAIKKLEELYTQGETLYAQLESWKTATDTELAAWRTETMAAITAWESDLLTTLDAWKAGTISDYDAQFATFEATLQTYITTFNGIQTAAAGSASAAAASATEAATSAASVTASANKITALELTSAANLHWNLIGNVANTRYPLRLDPGDYCTISREDGAAFDSDNAPTLKFSETLTGSSVLTVTPTSGTYRRITNATSTKHYRYVWLEAPSSSPLMMVYGQNAMTYKPYNTSSLENRIETLEAGETALAGRMTTAEGGITTNAAAITALDGRLDTAEDTIDSIQKIRHEFKMLNCGTFTNNNRPFTSDDVIPGDVIYYKFTSPAGQGLGELCMLNGSNQTLSLYNLDPKYVATNPSAYVGHSSPIAADTVYEGYFIVPDNFHHAIIYTSTGTNLVFDYLYANIFDDRMLDIDLEIPQYYFRNNYLPGKISDINTILAQTAAYGDSFIFITDLHMHVGPNGNKNQYHSQALASYISKHSCIDKLFIGGDIYDVGGGPRPLSVPLENQLTTGYMQQMHEGFNGSVYFIPGNHDFFKGTPTSRITTFADAQLKDYNGNSQHHYYYFDNPRVKIRYIVVADYYELAGNENDNAENGIYADANQRTWLAATLASMEAGWGAIVLSHTIYVFKYDTDQIMHITNTGRTIMKICNTYNANPDSAGEVMAIIQGHTHCDRIMYTPDNLDPDTPGGIPIIAVTSDQNGGCFSSPPDVVPNDSYPTGSLGNRVSGTIREQAFDAIVIDRRKDEENHGTIYAIRIGCEAYDGEGLSSFGSATQMRTVKFPTKFDANDWQ